MKSPILNQLTVAMTITQKENNCSCYNHVNSSQNMKEMEGGVKTVGVHLGCIFSERASTTCVFWPSPSPWPNQAPLSSLPDQTSTLAFHIHSALARAAHLWLSKTHHPWYLRFFIPHPRFGVKSFCYPGTGFASYWVSQPKDTNKPKTERRKDLLLLAASKENTGDLSQSSVSLNNRTW